MRIIKYIGPRNNKGECHGIHIGTPRLSSQGYINQWKNNRMHGIKIVTFFHAWLL
jgi:hypothetical protein